MKNPVFARHSREFADNLYTYPVISRRSRGLSLGVNLSMRKECNFDCVYCQVDRKEIQAKERVIDFTIFQEELQQLVASAVSGEIFQHPRFAGSPSEYQILNDIALSGDGEPTTSKYFLDCCAFVEKLILQYREKNIHIKPIVITNASVFHKEKVFAQLVRFHKLGGGPWVKLDAGSEEEFKHVAETTIPFQRILSNIRLLGQAIPLTLQSIIYQEGSRQGLSFNVEKMVACLNDLQAANTQIAEMQLYTLARSTRVENLSAISADRLEEIADFLHKKTSIAIKIYP
ncbi:MAG: hypothetical protein AAF518_03380 [Spirochaetota bacterium]